MESKRTQKSFGKTFGETRADTVVSIFPSPTGRLRVQRPQLQKIPASETTYQRRRRHRPPQTRADAPRAAEITTAPLAPEVYP